MSMRGLAWVVVFVSTLWGAHGASAQHFGRNKVEYLDFDFRFLETEHFHVYYYPREEQAARIVARLAERWYARLSRVLEHRLAGRQTLILYGSQPEFAQTNVVDGFLGEGIGGVTESARRRIVMPFAPTLAETDRILGHELTHAFQFDMAKQYGGGVRWPLWSIEGLAQYLALGASGAETAMWLGDAVRSDLLPRREKEAARRFSPYTYGHAVWAYLAGRFGDRIVPRILKDKRTGSLPRRIQNATGLELDEVYADWREASVEHFDARVLAADAAGTTVSSTWRAGRFQLGPALSPDGSKVVFFSEKDRMSLDLFLADTVTGEIVRKLATTATALRFESLQAIRSAGSWSPDGAQFVFAAIDRGEPTLVLIDVGLPGRQREIRLPQFGQILTPSWSPDGRRIAFSALEGGLTDVYVYDLDSGALRQITDDPYADLQPQWSPDGLRLVFVTDRFSTDLPGLRFGRWELALAALQSGSMQALPAIPEALHLNPHWSADGKSIFFLSDANGASNVYRLELGTATVSRLTDISGGVAGLTSTSPALSVASHAEVLAFTVFRKGRYELAIRRGAEALLGRRAGERTATNANALPPIERADSVVDDLLTDDEIGLDDSRAIETHAYEPKLDLEALGSPYLSSGGGPFGTFVRGGGSLLFGDLLGDRRLGIFAQAGNRLRDLALRVRFLNRERRWNWGAIAEALPSLQRLPRIHSSSVDGEPAVTREIHYLERTSFRLAAHLAYPLNQAERIEFEAGARHVLYRTTVNSVNRASEDGRLLSREVIESSGTQPATFGEASAAYVRDTAVYGPTSPIVGARSRFEISSTFGELAVTRLLIDYRRYLMPVKPYTVAVRGVHLGQYGPQAHDERMLPTFLGSRSFIRGYGWNSIRCGGNPDCGAFEELLGSRLLVGNLEVRAPLIGVRSRDLRYGPLPLEGFLFVDSGLVWSRSPAFSTTARGRRLVSSLGAGVRVNAFGFPIETAVVRATDASSRGWSFDFGFHYGF
ncbi:MAG TPA: BamA/TamA family outer membrane protein [Vicinamibacterales bacterium]|nr:BamA/TamA family outer membrane protein [Vicinamibacterales bacterium]